jgi:ATP-binding cassette subfamily B protein
LTANNLEIVIGKLRRAWAQLPYLPRAIFLVWSAAGSWTAAWLVVLVIQGVLPVATVYLTRAIVNSLVAAIRASGTPSSLRPVLLPVSLMVGVLLVGEVLRGISQWIRASQADLVQAYISDLVHQKSSTVDLGFYESPDFYDHLHRARAEAGHRPVALVESVGSILRNGITLVAMLGVLIPFGPWLPLALLSTTLPALYLVLRYAMLRHDWQQRVTVDERRIWYFDWLLAASETAAELRLFGLKDYFRASLQSLLRKLRLERLDLTRRESLAEFGAGLTALVITGSAMAWMGWKAIRGLVSLGDLALFYQAFQQGLQLMRSMLDDVGQLYQNSLFLGNLFEFLALQPTVVDPPNPVPVPSHGLVRFSGVTFRYPGSRGVALQDFDVTILAGQMAAIVGPNGAGKSTFIKLLCRFYDPEAGRIELDGVDLRNLSIDELRRNITVLFQEPVHYNASAAENIALGDIDREQNLTQIQSAARSAGADTVISKLPRGYQNLLGSWFEEGAQISVGEWQRIALARAFLRKAPIIALDEPTSAMDPWAEAEWMARFRTLQKGRTAILITHRFTTAMFADIIHVMHDGRVVESGTHAELLARGGLYARGWHTRTNEA